MLVSEISLWGAALVALLVIISVTALAFIDRKMLQRMLVIFGATVAQMVVVVAVVWLVYQTHAWLTYLLWYLLILLLSICWVLYPLQSMWKKMLLPVGTAILVGSIVVGGSTILCLPISVFMTVYSVLMACLTASMIQTMGNYQRYLHNPETCKLSWRERMLPNIRSMGQPLVVVIPTLFAGMLLGGVSVLDSLIVVFLLVAAAFVANVLAGVVALVMLTFSSIHQSK
jgi:ABC-type iron transport system FetAB permease component